MENATNTQNYARNYALTEEHDFNGFFSNYENVDEKLKPVKKEIKEANRRIAELQQEIDKIYAQRYNKTFTPTKLKAYLSYDKKDGYHHKRIYFDVDGTSLSCAPSNEEYEIEIHLDTARGSFHCLKGYCLELGAAIFQTYNYSITVGKEIIKLTPTHESIYPILNSGEGRISKDNRGETSSCDFYCPDYIPSRYRYFTPFNERAEWWDRDTYCCPNNYKRMVFEIPDSVVRRAGDGLAVCLYAPAVLKSGGYVVKMATAYPESGTVTLSVTMPEGEKSLFLRIPKWCASAVLEMDGVTRNVTSGWLQVRRNFAKGIGIKLEMPMPIRLVKGCRAQEGRVAVMRGPCVYALERKINGLQVHGIDLWDLDVAKPMTWCGEEHAIKVGVRFRHLAREERTVLLTRYFREDRERTYFELTGPKEADEDEIAPSR